MSEREPASGSTACCLGCTKRTIGCHNVATCPDWAEEVQRRKADREARAAAKKVTMVHITKRRMI